MEDGRVTYAKAEKEEAATSKEKGSHVTDSS